MNHIEFKQARLLLGLTQKEIAQVLKCSDRFIRAIEKGEKKVPPGMASEILDLLSIIEDMVVEGVNFIKEFEPKPDLIDLVIYSNQEVFEAYKEEDSKVLKSFKVHSGVIGRVYAKAKSLGFDVQMTEIHDMP